MGAIDYDLHRQDAWGNDLDIVPLTVEASYSPGSPAGWYHDGEPEEVELDLVIRRDTGAVYPLTDSEREAVVAGIIDDLRRDYSDYRSVVRANNRRPILGDW